MISGNIIYDLVSFFVALLTIVVVYYKWSFTYWKRRGLAQIEPSIPFGNIGKLFMAKMSCGQQFHEIYKELKARGLKHGGVYMLTRPFYVPIDPVIVKNIIQRDFQYFVNRGFYVNEIADPLSGNLLALEDSKWKNLRTKLTPTFTSGKMKLMFETLSSCAEGLEQLIDEFVASGKPLDTKDILARFTTDVIGSCAFGLETNSLANPDSKFRKVGKRILENTVWESIRGLLSLGLSPKLLKMINYKASKPDVEKFILDVVKKTVDYREKHNVVRKDFLQLLLKLKNENLISNNKISSEENNEGSMSIKELAAQVFIFFLGGFETSATTMTFALYEIAKNKKIQDKIRKEIKSVLMNNNGKITYDALAEMTYLENVIQETLRKHPPAALIPRICTAPYDVPNTDLHLDKGTMVMIPVLGFHRDPEYYPEPEKFDPERFSDENKRSNGPGLTYMPFGEGPRICIGLRFAMMLVKVGLATILNNYQLTINEKTKQPLVLDPTAFVTTTKDGIWLDATKAN